MTADLNTYSKKYMRQVKKLTSLLSNIAGIFPEDSEIAEILGYGIFNEIFLGYSKKLRQAAWGRKV